MRAFIVAAIVSQVFVGIELVSAAEVSTQVPEIQSAVVSAGDGVITTVKPAKPTPNVDFAAGPAAEWIWAADEPQQCWLRHTFETNAKSAVLIATCDNVMSVKLNGKSVANSSTWQNPVTVDVTKSLKAGANTLTANVKNDGAGGARGFVLKLLLTGEDGSKEYVVTNTKWEFATDKDFENTVDGVSHGKMGVGPWNNVFAAPGSSPAPGLTSSVPRDVFQLLPGFQVELLYTVPKAEQGSWVSIAFDDKGRLLASDQGGKGLFRITPPPIGSKEETRVEHLDVAITSSQGMLWAFDSLYVSVNGGPGSGLYRLTDTNDDDQFDNVEKLKALQGGGEHGPHALRLSPDGESIYIIAGNHTNPPEEFDSSRIRSNWGEDLLLPRQWDARGHARGKLAPGGWIAKTDPDGKTWEMVSIGYRNPYDMDFSPEGELFAYDADMEWDMGSSWYRPTRICHAVSGSEFGWRSGTGKWPTWNVDSLPEVVDIGPGSPVGVEFGTGTKFPAKYQRALYCCDWTFGTMYAVHLTPKGSSYVGEREEFLSRTPLPLTDTAVGPDGALYFTVGGRGAQSALFRVTYVGDDSTAPAEPVDDYAALRELRHKIEELHVEGQSSKDNVEWLWPNLGHADRHIRYAARTALEFQDRDLWQSLVLAESDPQTLITASVALSRQGEANLRDKLAERLLSLKFADLGEQQQLEYLRAVALVFIRLGDPSPAVRQAFAGSLEVHYPAKSPAMNRELVQMLVYLNSPKVIAKTLKMLQPGEQTEVAVDIPEVLARNSGYGGTIAKMLANQVNLDHMNYAFTLRNMKYGWTLEQRREYLAWYGEATGKSGGASFQGFLKNMQNDWLALATESERKALAGDIVQNAPKEAELPKPKGPGKEWTMDELVALTQSGLTGRSFENGKRAYAASRCISCHRYTGEGGSTGPDVTNVAGRFSYKDLLESMIDPSKVVSDQYRASIITTNAGKVYTGRVLGEADGKLSVLVDPVDITKVVEIAKDDVDEQLPSPTSLMPQKLLNTLNQDEVLDLLAYLMSRGNPNDPVFAD